MRTPAALGWWLCLGCLQPQAPALPGSDGEVGTTLLILLEEGRPTEGWVHAGQDPTTLSFGEQREVGLLALGPAPAALSLSPGRLRLDQPGRPLPLELIVRSLRRDPDTGAFVPASPEEAAALAELNLPSFDYPRCLANGCLEDDRSFPLCKTTCEIQNPRPPELPRLEQPTGWVLDDRWSERLSISRPLQPPLIDCPPTWAQLPGQAECQPLLEGCPADGWPVGTADAYVDPAAPAGGDGSRLRPYTRIDEALATPAAPARLALARGRHLVPSTLPARLELRGACSETVLVGELVVQDQRLVIRDLAWESARSSLTVAGGYVGLERVSVSPAARNHDFAWVVNGGTVSATQALFLGGWGGVELRAGHLHLARAAINTRGGPGVWQRQGQSRLSEVVLRAGTASAAWGLRVDQGQLQVRDAVIEGFADGGLRVEGQVEAQRLVIRRNFTSLGGGGVGVFVGGGRLTLSEVEVSEHPAEGLRVVGGGRATLTTVRFLDNVSAGRTHGVVIDLESELEADDLVSSGAHGSQIFLEGSAELPDQAPLALRDVVAIGVGSGEELEALVVGRTGPVDLQRALVVGGDNGTLVSTNRGRLTGSDWTLQPRDRGLRIFDGASFDLARIQVQGGTVPVSINSNNLSVASIGTLVDLEVLAGPLTRTGLEVGRADVTLERYRMIGTGDNAEAVSVIQAPGRLEDQTAFGHLRARWGFLSGWTTGFSLSSEAQAAEAMAEAKVENTAVPLVITAP